MLPALICLMAVALDRRFGEPRRWHPLVGFGLLASRVEAVFYGPTQRRGRGIAALIILVVPPMALAAGLAAVPVLGVAVEITLLYLALGGTSLAEHAARVEQALQCGDLALARERVGLMVSRDTGAMDEEQISRAAVESVLENGCDAVFGALFWYLVAGAAGVVVYRLVNTLDAMWGYRTPRYFHFGWAAARCDDLLNWLPARLTALTYAAVGRTAVAWRCWRIQAAAWPSPNAGPVMAAGAGALGLRLGGGAPYHGRWIERPLLGEGAAATAADVGRAVALVERSLWLWLGVVFLGGFLDA